MSRRYLYGPVRMEWIEQHLPIACRDGTCVPFGPEDTWESACARLPAGIRPEFIAVYLAYATVPAWVWEATIPLVGLAMDWNLQIHHYRNCARRCELVLTDAPGVAVLARDGITHARAANLYGPDAAWMAWNPPDELPTWDLLFVGNLNAVVQRDRLGWLGRIARLADRWRVLITTGVFGDEYRKLHGTARIVVNRSVRGEANQRVFEAALAGCLLMQEAENLEVPALLADRRECVLYTDDNLEELLDYYLSHEEERQAIAQAARQKALHCSYEEQWGRTLTLIESEWESLTGRAARRVAQQLAPTISARVWEALGTHGPTNPSLLSEVEAALATNPNSAALHNALGLAVTLTRPEARSSATAMAEVAVQHFLDAVRRDPTHVIAGLNLAEALVSLQQHKPAVETCRRMLAALAAEDEQSVPTWLEDGHFPPGFDAFRVEWERCAWQHPGNRKAEASAKRDLVRWRLHGLLATLTGEIGHYHEAALARPDLAETRAALGCALARDKRFPEAVTHLRRAVEANPFDRMAARALYQALHDAADPIAERRFARQQRLLAKTAPKLVPVEQWFHKARPVGDELASLIILCCNEVEVSRLCLESVLAHTRKPYELILVDNGSTDATPALLEEVRQRPGPARVVVIRNEENKGFPAGCNQGLAQARGEYLVLLNNDTVVTPGWLDGLVRWSLHNWPAVGLVGAVSNYAPPPQLVEPGYADLAGLTAFAERRRQQFAGQALETPRLTGFCLLVRRAVLEKVGSFDEQYGVGFFDDDDLCIRARRAGFRLLVAQDVYIHHFGSQTFKALGVDCQKQLHDNLARFAQKWGAEEASHYHALGEQDGVGPFAAALTPTVVVPSGEKVGRARVSCCIITRNEAKNIADCIRCVIDLVDEVIVQDTGSTDNTCQIARDLGARVFESTWQNSFSTARNECISHATGDWIVWVDADDRIDEENRQKLKALFASLGQENLAFVMKCLCVPDGQSPTGTVVNHVRLFRRSDSIRWEHRVHEQILPSAKASGAQSRHLDIVIRHIGYVDGALRQKKLERDVRLLRLEEAEQGDRPHPFTQFNLGMCLLDAGQQAAALGYLRQSLRLSGVQDSIVRKLYAMMARCQLQMGELRAALAEVLTGRQHYPDDEELLWLEGRLREGLSDLPGAEAAFTRLVGGRDEEHLGSVEQGLRTFLGRDALARVCFRQGRTAEAGMHWAQVVAEAPGFLPAWEGLADVLMAEQRWAEAEQALLRVLEIDQSHAAARSNLEVVRRHLGR